MKISGKRFPVLTLFLLAPALAAEALSWLTGWIEYDRAAIAQGQFWRFFSGHWTHFNLDHLTWDGAVFLALGIGCEWKSPVRFLACVFGSALLISAAVWVFMPGLQIYRGLSGIDSALFATQLTDVIREKWHQQEWGWILAGALLGTAFFAKVIFEIATGSTFFVDSAAAGMIPVPLAHLVGFATGIGTAAVGGPRKSKNPNPKSKSRIF